MLMLIVGWGFELWVTTKRERERKKREKKVYDPLLASASFLATSIYDPMDPSSFYSYPEI